MLMSHAKDQFFLFIAPPLGHSLLAGGLAALAVVLVYIFTPFKFLGVFAIAQFLALIYVIWQGGRGFAQKFIGVVLWFLWVGLQLFVAFFFVLSI